MPHGSGGCVLSGAAVGSPSLATADLRDARVLVTGASGFIGTGLCRSLQSCGARVIATVHGEASHDTGVMEVHHVDVRDRDAVHALVHVAAPDYVVHLAAVKVGGAGLPDYRSAYQANLFATMHLAEAVINTGSCRRFVYLSSAEEYGRAPVPFDSTAREAPLSAYGLSKLAATQLLQALAATHGLAIAVLRATVVYGPGQHAPMFVPALVRALVAGKRFSMTAGAQNRDLVYIDDVIDAILRALVMTARHDEVLHVSAGNPVSIRDVALLAARLVGGNSESLLDFGAVAYRPGEAMDYWAANLDTRDVLGWSPRISLEEGLLRTIANFRRPVVGK